MVQLGCVDIPFFPLQLLLRDHPAWQDLPVAVVDRDSPQGVIEWVNEKALAQGVRIGMRYGVALSLSSELRAGEVSNLTVTAEMDTLLETLRTFSPVLERADDEPGVFWLSAVGLSPVFDSPRVWITEMQDALKKAGFSASIVCGFRRFATYAVAKSRQGHGLQVFPSEEREKAAADRVPLLFLGLPPETHELLGKLRVRTVGDYLKLPAPGILRRFGPEAHRIHRLATGEDWEKLTPEPLHDPVHVSVDLDEAESDLHRLLFLVKQQLHTMLHALAQRSEALETLELTLHLFRADPIVTFVRPAEPTLDMAQLTGLVHLRLESMPFTDGVKRLSLTARSLRATQEQLQLFAENPRREPRAAERALARLRSLFGEQAVAWASLEQGHLPEATYAFRPMHRLPMPEPVRRHIHHLVRRVFPKPEALPSTRPHHHEGWLLRGVGYGPVTRLRGPYAITGGWWRKEVQRDYYFTELHSGEWLWVYFDRRRNRWFLHGTFS